MASDAPFDSAGEAVADAVSALVARIAETETAAVRNEPDGVHQHRTAVRRLRSVLAAYRRLFDGPSVDRLRIRFDELGSQLGVVRDIEVRADFAAEMFEDYGDVPGEMRARLIDDERAEFTEAQARLADLLGSPRAKDRRAELAAFVESPPFGGPADQRAEKAIRRALRHEVRRVARAAAALDDEDLDTYHRLRKAARRLRYAAEAVPAERLDLSAASIAELAAAGERVHDVLGDHRDGLIFAEHLERAGGHAAHAGEPSDDYARLAALARDRATAGLSRLSSALVEIEDAGRAIDR